MSANPSRRKLGLIIGLAVIGLILFGLFMLTLVGITGRVSAPGRPEVREVIVEREMAAPMEAPAAMMAEEAMVEGVVSYAPADDFDSSGFNSEQRMIIRSGELAVVVEDTETSLLNIRDIATSHGGFVANTNLWRANDQLRGTVTIRVPAESFDAAMDQIKDQAIKVERENVSGQDVTEEYTDLSARLRNLEATEAELLALLTEVREKTRRAEDVLAVHRELTNIRGQIEQIKGRMQYLERMTALATIHVDLIPEEEITIVEEGWQPLNTLRAALNALVSAGQFLVEAAIWVIAFALPLLLLLVLPLAIIWWLWRRRRRRRADNNDS